MDMLSVVAGAEGYLLIENEVADVLDQKGGEKDVSQYEYIEPRVDVFKYQI